MIKLATRKFNYPIINLKTMVTLTLLIVLMFICMHAFAEDLLKDTETNLVDTIQGTGKKYLYIGEVAVASLAWLYSRKASAFLGVLILSAGINVVLKVGGII